MLISNLSPKVERKRKVKDKFICINCGKTIFNKYYKKLIKYCSLNCFNLSEITKENRRNNGIKVGLYRERHGHTWGDKISKAKTGKERPDMKGSNNWNWKGGFNSEERRWVMNRQPYKEWRRKVFERDAYTCKICGDKNGGGKTIKLEAHHIVYWNEASEKEKYDIKLGMTICRPCHIIGHQVFK